MSLHIEHDVPLKQHTTFKTGGPAKYFVTAQSEGEVQDASLFAERHQLPLFVLGGGSNVLIADEGFDGVVVYMQIPGTQHIEKGNEVYIRVGAGVVWDTLVADTVARGFWGLENLSAIPGTVGASVIQNIGAYGVEVGSCVHSVRVYDRETDIFFELTPAQCTFGYRTSLFKDKEKGRYIVTEVTFVLYKNGAPKLGYKDLSVYFGDCIPTLAEVRTAVCEVRAGKFPDLNTCGTAGSFFMNPIVSHAEYDVLKKKYPELPAFETDNGIKVSAAWMLDHILDMKGKRNQNESVGCHIAQPLVIVNYADATTQDILQFGDAITERIKDKTNIEIKREVSFIHSH